MNVLITGASGQLGRSLKKVMPDATFSNSEELDITNASSLAKINWGDFDVIINAAGYTAVDKAEDYASDAWQVNCMGPLLLAEVARKNDITLVHVSSDYVYDGKEIEHFEDEALRPMSVYGASKAAGDLAVQIAPKHYILRTSWVVGDGSNFVRTMLKLGQTKAELSVVNDQIGRLTFATDLANAATHLISEQPEFGTYHISNTGEPASWADIARKIFDITNLPVEVKDIATETYSASISPFAHRPKNSTLNLDKIEATGYHAPDWQEALEQYIREEQSR